MKPTKSSQIQGLKNDVSLFGRLYIANQQREGDPATFFPMKTRLFHRLYQKMENPSLERNLIF